LVTLLNDEIWQMYVMVAAGQILVRMKSKSGFPMIKSLPRHDVVPYFSPDEKVKYRDPVTGQISLATVRRANGEQWPPFYSISLEDNARGKEAGHPCVEVLVK